VNIFEHLVLS